MADPDEEGAEQVDREEEAERIRAQQRTEPLQGEEDQLRDVRGRIQTYEHECRIHTNEEL